MREKIFTIDPPLKAGVSLSSQRSLKISCNLPKREGTFEFSRSNLETSLIPVLLLLIKVRTRFEKQRKKLENAKTKTREVRKDQRKRHHFSTMATAQTPRNVTSNWSDFFPAELDQQQSSTTFVRKLVAVGVSQILYLRSELPDEVFESTDLDGLPLKMLKGSHDESKGLCELLSNALSGVKRR